MVDKDINANIISQKLNISLNAVYRKLNGTTEFKQSEIKELIDLFGLNEEEVINIFFDGNLS